VCIVAVGVRAWLAWTAVAIFVDSALFIDYAQRLAVEPVAVMRAYDQHPLYPALVLGVHTAAAPLLPVGNDGWIAAGRLAAIAGSLAAIVGMYWLAARLYGRRVGLIAAGMLAVLPDACQFGAGVLSDMPHLGFYLLGLAALVTGMQVRRVGWLIAAAALSAAAFLTRPEGGAVLLVGVVGVLLQRGRSAKRRLGIAAAMGLTFFALAGSYQVILGDLVPKKSLKEMFGFEDLASIRVPGGEVVAWRGGQPLQLGGSANANAGLDGTCGACGWFETAVQGPRDGRCGARPLRNWDARETIRAPSLAADLPVTIDLFRQWARAGKVVYILLAVVGLLLCPPRGVGGRLLAAAAGVHIALLHALAMSFHYLDLRHALLLAALSLPLAAAGAWELAGRLGRRARATEEPAGGGRATAAVGPGIGLAVILALCVALTSPWLRRPINAGEEHVTATARWLRANTPPGAMIVGDRRMHRVATHADRPFEEWQRFRAAPRAAYFVVDELHTADPARNPAGFEAPRSPRPPEKGDVALVHSEASPDYARRRTHFYVYRFEPK
jgi:hypothetical protein